MKFQIRSIYLILIALTFSLFILGNSYKAASANDGTEDSPKSTLFVLDTCPHCEALIEELKGLDLGDFSYELIEISSEENRALISEAVQICNEDNPGVPLLFYENKCYVGKVEAGDQIKILAGLKEPDQLEEEDNEDATLINTDSPNESADGEITGESGSLADRIGDGGEREKITPAMLILMLGAPISFIFLSVYLLKRFKL